MVVATTLAPFTVPGFEYKALVPVKLTLRVVASVVNAFEEVTLTAEDLALAVVVVTAERPAKPNTAAPT
ncbi:hypothetical protein ACLOA8_11360 [Levilactobacillus brevis]|uniref:hypothetical protein n=1 Tax=Levilactobacillus brevis TaxID=1580 RepID=UPI003EBF3EEE